MFPTVMIVANVATVGVLWFGGHRVENGNMQVGALTAYISYLMQIVMSVMMAMFMLMMVPRASVCADRITEVLDTDSSVVPPTDPSPTCPSGSTLELDGVTFAYPGADEPVLREVTLTARPGRDAGHRRLDRRRQVDPRQPGARASSTPPGEPYASAASTYARSSSRRSGRGSGLVPQKAFLFRGTVADNLRYGKPDATEDEMWAALEIAQAQRLRRGACPTVSTPRSPRAARASAAASGSGWRSRAR